MTHADELRTWAKGGYAQEAATELLLRWSDGRFAALGNPWIRKDDFNSTPWIDFASIPEHADSFCITEERFLLIAASLAANVPVVLCDVLPWLGSEEVQLLLAAISHSTDGSREHSVRIRHKDGTMTLARLSSLYPWPEEHASGL